jgi:plasmid segregation protein ParM
MASSAIPTSLNTMSLLGGIDVGNGYVKGLVRGERTDKVGKPIIDTIDLPSGVTLVTRPNALPRPDDEAVEVCTNDLYNDLDVSFSSPMVSNAYRHLFGTRSLTANGAFDEFNVVGRRSKAEQELSKVLILGCFATKALRDYVAVAKALPVSELVVDARVAVALPIDEYMRHRTSYSAEFMNGTHLVTVHNFDTPVTVRITFSDVVVMAEGASAQWAITEKGVPLMKAMLADVRSRGLALEGVSAEDVLAARNTIGIDIGEGTVNFPIFTNGKFNADASVTFGEGYGTVLTRALESMDAEGVHTGFTSRKQLADFLQHEPSALKRNFYEKVRAYVDREIEFFARATADQFGRVLSVVGATTEVVFVFGGGSGPVKDALYPLLLAKVAEMNSEDAMPVLYLDASYSRSLNREGLYSIAQASATQSSKAAKPAKRSTAKNDSKNNSKKNGE